MKPFLTNKGVNGGKITLIENERILSADGQFFFSPMPPRVLV